MVQLWFSTAIPWITKPTQVVTESKKPIPITPKPKFPVNKPLLASNNVSWLVKPKRQDEKLVMQAVAELTDSTLSWTWANVILDKYSSKLSSESFNDVMTISSDLMNGSWKKEMQEAYKTKMFDPEMIWLVHDIFTDTKSLSQPETIQEEPIKSNIIKDIWEWIVDYAWWIPKIIAGFWLLDKPADWLVENIANPIRIRQWKDPLQPWEYKSFSEYVNGSQVWWNVESAAKKTTSTILSWLELLTWVPMLVKWATKIAAKKWLIKLWEEAKTIKSWEDVIKNKSFRKLWNYIQPKQTSKEISDAGSSVIKWEWWQAIAWRTEATFFKKPQNIPTKQSIHKIQTAAEYWIDAWKSFESQANTAAQWIQKISKEIDNSVRGANRIFNKKELASEFNKIANAPSDITTKNKKIIQNIFMEYANKEKWNIEWLHKARMAFYKDNRIAKILWWPQNDMQEYVKEISGAVKNIIWKTSPKYKELVRKEAELYDIMKNISTKMKDQSMIAKFYKDNESLIKWLWYSAAIWYGGIETLKAISWN